MAKLHILQPRRDVGTGRHLVELVGHQQRRNVLVEKRKHFGIGLIEAACFDDEEHQIDVVDDAQNRLVERAVKRVAVPGLEAGRIDKDKLGCSDAANARDAVARGLRLARGDADLLPNQRIEQCGLADIGLTNDRNQPASLRRRTGRRVGNGLPVRIVRSWRLGAGHPGSRSLSVWSIAAAAACSPARREPPMPRSAKFNSTISHSTSKDCWCAAPMVPTTR